MTDVCAPGKGKPAPHTLARKVFRVSRLAEFASVAELIKQTGHPVADWPLVIVKELADNALDAAEEAGIAPEIEIVVADGFHHGRRPGSGHRARHGRIAGRLFGPTSTRAAYVSPTRGAAGQRAAKHPPHGLRARR